MKCLKCFSNLLSNLCRALISWLCDIQMRKERSGYVPPGYQGYIRETRAGGMSERLKALIREWSRYVKDIRDMFRQGYPYRDEAIHVTRTYQKNDEGLVG